MSPIIYKSIRCLVFGVMLFFAGATDSFSVDLDNDGDIDTDAIVTSNQVNSVRPSVASPEERIFSSSRPLSVPVSVSAETPRIQAPLDLPGPALSSPLLLIPLRT